MSEPKTVVSIPETPTEMAAGARELLDIANDFVIDGEDTRQMADEQLAGIKREKKRIDARRTYLKTPLLEAERRLDAEFRPLIDYCDRAIAILQPKILGYDRELAAARAEEQRKAQEAADAQKRKLEEQAAALQQSGATEAAAAVKEAATLVTAPHIPIAVSTAARSTVTRVTWSAEVTNLMDLVLAVATGEAPLQALQADMTYLNGRARTDKDALKIPGVKANPIESLAAKRVA